MKNNEGEERGKEREKERRYYKNSPINEKNHEQLICVQVS